MKLSSSIHVADSIAERCRRSENLLGGDKGASNKIILRNEDEDRKCYTSHDAVSIRTTESRANVPLPLTGELMLSQIFSARPFMHSQNVSEVCKPSKPISHCLNSAHYKRQLEASTITCSKQFHEGDTDSFDNLTLNSMRKAENGSQLNVENVIDENDIVFMENSGFRYFENFTFHENRSRHDAILPSNFSNISNSSNKPCSNVFVNDDNSADNFNGGEVCLSKVREISNYTDYIGHKNELTSHSNYVASDKFYEVPRTSVKGFSVVVSKELMDNKSKGISDLTVQAHYLDLRPVTEIPQKFRPLFPFSYFNIIQTKALDDALYTDKSLVIGAPTGSGKTVVFELAMLRLILLKEIKQIIDFKVIYMAPIKALVSEKFDVWKNKFSTYGLACCELTGDSDLEDYFELTNVQLILTTPEKWDFMTRRWKHNRSLMKQIKLLLIDEVHTISDGSRGATLEAVINRMKTVKEFEKLVDGKDEESSQSIGEIRFVAVSATIPNIDDLAKWLGKSESSAAFYQMDESQRPVPLKKVVLGYAKPNPFSAFKFDLMLNYRLPHVLELYSDMKPSIVFCSTRKGTTQAAQVLAKEMKFFFRQEDIQWLKKASYQFRDSKLSELVARGIAYHHAGMDVNDRKLVEKIFLSGRMAVLLSTTTLALGVNLPAHLVIIKSTQHYVMGEYVEYSENQVLQMIGRAGRPQFDNSATAVIMTQNETKRRYESLLNGTQLVESSLHHHLIEHLNAEIVLETITDIPIALRWIEASYLFVRIHKNPENYGIESDETSNAIKEKLHEICLSSLKKLACLDLIKMDLSSLTLTSTEAGRLMSKYCVAFETIKNFSKLTGEESLEDLLKVFCSCEEFKDLILRMSEKRVLNELNKHKNKATIRFPVKDKIKNAHSKINCLIQAQLGCLPLQDFTLQQDTNKIFRTAPRIASCLFDLFWNKPHFKLLYNSLLLSKCLRSRLWENSRFVAKQFTGIGLVMATALVNNAVTTFDQLLKTNPRNLELMVNRQPPFGNILHSMAKMLPKYDLQLFQTNQNAKRQEAEMLASVRLINAMEILSSPTCSLGHTCVLLVGTSSNEIICKVKIRDSMLMQQDNHTWIIKFAVKQNFEGNVIAHLVSQEWVGLDLSLTYAPSFIKNSLPSGIITPAIGKQMLRLPNVQKSMAKDEKETPKNEYERCIDQIKRQHESVSCSSAFKRLKSMTPSISNFSFENRQEIMTTFSLKDGLASPLIPYHSGALIKSFDGGQFCFSNNLESNCSKQLISAGENEIFDAFKHHPKYKNTFKSTVPISLKDGARNQDFCQSHPTKHSSLVNTSCQSLLKRCNDQNRGSTSNCSTEGDTDNKRMK